MAKIKKLHHFDKSKLKNLYTFLKENNHNSFIEVLNSSLLSYIHYYLPLKYKFLKESYVLTETKNTLGTISVNTFNGNYKKLNISQLLFLENSYEIAQQLVEYIISQYGAMGANSFYILIDYIYDELAQTLINNCGFRQFSTEQIWEISKKSFKNNKNIKYRRFKRNDVDEVADIYNDSVLTHFKPTLTRKKEEFDETFCSGLQSKTEYRYVIEDDKTSRIIAYFKISTSDNENFIVDFNYSNGYEVDFDTIFYFATREILKRKRRFKLYAKLKNYINTNTEQEEYFISKKFKCINTKLLLIKDFYTPIKCFSEETKFVTLGGLHNSPTF